MAQSNRGLWIGLGVGCGALALVSLVCVGSVALMGGGIWAATEPAADEAKGFLADLRRHDLDAAYARMSADYRSQHDVARFREEVGTMPELLSQTDDTVTGRSISGSSGRITAELATPNGTRVVIVLLHHESGGWRVDGVEPRR